MAITVDVQNNPDRSKISKLSADAVTINSGLGAGVVTYEIRRRDQQGETMTFVSNRDYTTTTQVVSITHATLKVVLPFRTNFQVRVKLNSDSFSSWFNFKTRDKRYQSPDAISQLSDDLYLNAATKGSVTVNVTNSAKGIVAETPQGATVTNSDKMYASVTSISYTSAGATIEHSD